MWRIIYFFLHIEINSSSRHSLLQRRDNESNHRVSEAWLCELGLVERDLELGERAHDVGLRLVALQQRRTLGHQETGCRQRPVRPERGDRGDGDAAQGGLPDRDVLLQAHHPGVRLRGRGEGVDRGAGVGATA